MELTIGDKVYQFTFGIGFLKEINKSAAIPMDSAGNKRNVGLMYCVGSLVDRDVEELVKVLDFANKGQTPRITEKAINDYIDNECEDIEELFNKVLDFLSKSNACKLTVVPMMKEIEKQALN